MTTEDLTIARLGALQVLARHGQARYSNRTLDGDWPAVYWRHADWFCQHGYTTRHTLDHQPHVRLTEAGRDFAESCGIETTS